MQLGWFSIALLGTQVLETENVHAQMVMAVGGSRPEDEQRCDRFGDAVFVEKINSLSRRPS